MASFRFDISNQCSSLSYGGGASSASVNFTAGGIAVLTAPNIPIDGKVVKVRLAGNINVVDTTNLPIIALTYGNSLPASFFITLPLSGSGFSGTHGFVIEAELIFSSASGRISGFYNAIIDNSVSSFTSGGALFPGVVSQSDFQFFASVSSSTGNTFSSNATINLTEFSLKL